MLLEGARKGVKSTATGPSCFIKLFVESTLRTIRSWIQFISSGMKRGELDAGSLYIDHLSGGLSMLRSNRHLATYLGLRNSHHLQPKERTGPDVDGHDHSSINSKIFSPIFRSLFLVLGRHPTLTVSDHHTTPRQWSIITKLSDIGTLPPNSSFAGWLATPAMERMKWPLWYWKNLRIARSQQKLPIPNHIYLFASKAQLSWLCTASPILPLTIQPNLAGSNPLSDVGALPILLSSSTELPPEKK